MEFTKIYRRLNDGQRAAVDSVYGPMLVLAGPGTGKTQLLSARVASILNKTDAAPGNILCLTYTESGALNMRQRLSEMIGADSYDVTISTYHSFGSEIIKSYPEFFERVRLDREEDVRLERPIDDLGKMLILNDIVNSLPYGNPLLGARHYVKQVGSIISDLKQALITPDKLESLAKANQKQIKAVQPILDELINKIGGLPQGKGAKQKLMALYRQLLDRLKKLSGDIIAQAAAELAKAEREAGEQNTTRPLTTWKGSWLFKDSDGNFVFTDPAIGDKMLALAGIYRQYQQRLRQEALYDFDDMIIQAIDALKTKDELRYNLQERYQFILLDEFQDTNPAQFELIYQLANHPVHEGRPNIMAVGDDDQAIFAFQGADVSNMKRFLNSFKDVAIVNLTQNYRSHPDIIHVAHHIAAQIEERLHHSLKGVNKTLAAAGKNLPAKATIERHEFKSHADELGWVADKIAALVKAGTKPEEIAVLSPMHKYLEALVPFILKAGLPIAYEKRENILETPIVYSLIMMAELTQALAEAPDKAEELFPQVLSLPFFQIPPEDIWAVNWSARRGRRWPQVALKNRQLEAPVKFFLKLGAQTESIPLENMLDIFVGLESVDIGQGASYTSPLKQYYLSDEALSQEPYGYYETLSHLSVIRSKLRDFQLRQGARLYLRDLIDFYRAHKQANQPLVSTHPIAQAASSVNLMTVYKAKGLEFEHVFIINAHDQIWGKGARGEGSKIKLPPNLKQIRYRGSSEDELIRKLFVAVTRAKHGLFITSHSHSDAGKANEPVKYFQETEALSRVLPQQHRRINRPKIPRQQQLENVETFWRQRHLKLDASLKSLLKTRLEKYALNPTHLTKFVNLEYGGPQAFLIENLLRFPKAPSPESEYGNAVHTALQFYQMRANAGKRPSAKELTAYFEQELSRRHIAPDMLPRLLEQGKQELKLYLNARKEMFAKEAKVEVDFYREGVTLGEARLTGKIDRLEVDAQNRAVAVADYKTGKPLKKLNPSDSKALNYELQLYFYKLLVEHSHSWNGYRLESARLEFVKPSPQGRIAPPLAISFDSGREAKIGKLIQAVWHKIQQLDLPDTSAYAQNAKGSREFISDLIGASYD